MPTLIAPSEPELSERVALETGRQLTEPSSNEPRARLNSLDKFIELVFSTSRFLQTESQYQKLRSNIVFCSHLNDDWNSYGAEKPTVRTIQAVNRLLSRLHIEFFLPTRVIPSAEGGVAAYFSADDKTSYLEYRNSGEVILAMYDRQSEPVIFELSESDADESRALSLIRDYLTA